VTTAPIFISCGGGGSSFFFVGFLAFVVVFFFFFFGAGFFLRGGGASSSPPSEDFPSPVGSEPASEGSLGEHAASANGFPVDRILLGGSGAQSGVNKSASGMARISAGMTVSRTSTSPDGALCNVEGKGTASQASAIDGAPSGRSAQLGWRPMVCPGDAGNTPGDGRPAQLGCRLAAGGASLTSSSKMPRKDSFIVFWGVAGRVPSSARRAARGCGERSDPSPLAGLF